MSNLSLQKLLQRNQLWSPIHSSLDSFHKRKLGRADAYELIWRLIHVLECTAVTLAGSATARILTLSKDPIDTLFVREHLHGASWDANEERLRSQAGALDGSIGAWLEILGDIAKGKAAALEPQSSYLARMREFLSTPGVDLAGLRAAWSEVCDANIGESATVLAALKAANTFRNRFAHVPFPYDVLQGVRHALEECVTRIFNPPVKPSPLAGQIIHQHALMHGDYCSEHVEPKDPGEGTRFGFVIDKQQIETWDSMGFVSVDDVLRPSVLTKQINELGYCEYTRYRTERRSVMTAVNPYIAKWMPAPAPNDYLSEPEAGAGAFREGTRTLLHNRKFELAIPSLEQDVQDNPRYHSGWQRLAFARRELAVEKQKVGGEWDMPLLDKAIDAAKKSIQHKDPLRRADAHYNLSKCFYRRWEASEDSVDLDLAREHASEALSLSDEQKYKSWDEFLG